MPYVCTLGRGQVDGQCSALREKGDCVCSLQQLRSFSLLLYLSPVCDYLSRNSWMKGDLCRAATTIVARCATPVANADTLCQKLFLEKRVSRSLFDSTRSPPYLSPTRTQFRKRARPTQRCDRNKLLLLVNRARFYRVAIHAAGILIIT